MLFGIRKTLEALYHNVAVTACAAAAIAMGASARAATLVNPSFFGQANTTYQEWDGFSSPTSPNAATHVNNVYGTPDWFDTTAANDGAFFIGAPPCGTHLFVQRRS